MLDINIDKATKALKAKFSRPMLPWDNNCIHAIYLDCCFDIFLIIIIILAVLKVMVTSLKAD